MSESVLSTTTRLSRTVNVTGTSILRCDTCGTVCSSKSGFARHKCVNAKKKELISKNISVETDRSLLKCDECDKVATTPAGLKRHKTIKHKKKEDDQITRKTRSQSQSQK